jgi:hypothetical protein
MNGIENGTLYDCKPWETGILFDNTNLLNSFKQNLHYYEQGFRKFTIKSKCELPPIPNSKPNTLTSHKKLSQFDRTTVINKSTELPGRPPKHKKSNCTLRCAREEEVANKENKEECFTERQRKGKEDLKTKILQLQFEEQNKYKRMKKRDIHQVIFGDRNRNRRSR